MATRAQISRAEYLSMSFEGLDRDYVQGEVVERPMPNFEHGRAQGKLFTCFDRLEKNHQLYCAVELRMRLAQDIYRVADVAVFQREKPEPVPESPPLVVVEVLSSDDRWSDVLEKLDEYRTWGVAHIWLVDLARKRLFVYRSGDVVCVDAFRIPGLPVDIRYAEIAG